MTPNERDDAGCLSPMPEPAVLTGFLPSRNTPLCRMSHESVGRMVAAIHPRFRGTPRPWSLFQSRSMAVQELEPNAVRVLELDGVESGHAIELIGTPSVMGPVLSRPLVCSCGALRAPCFFAGIRCCRSARPGPGIGPIPVNGCKGGSRIFRRKLRLAV